MNPPRMNESAEKARWEFALGFWKSGVCLDSVVCDSRTKSSSLILLRSFGTIPIFGTIDQWNVRLTESLRSGLDTQSLVFASLQEQGNPITHSASQQWTNQFFHPSSNNVSFSNRRKNSIGYSTPDANRNTRNQFAKNLNLKFWLVYVYQRRAYFSCVCAWFIHSFWRGKNDVTQQIILL